MIPFLKSVAEAYSGRYGDLSNFCFVFPNKRSGTFFLKYLKRNENSGAVAPEITSITDFVERVGKTVVDNHISLLLTLYNCYCSLLPKKSRPDFDSFRPWGETVLSDFNDVGMNSVDTEALFQNLYDHKEISTDFLSDEQKQIMIEYFGQNAVNESDYSFWKHFNNPSAPEPKDGEAGEKIPLRKKFLKLWETLSPLYDVFNKTLKDKGLSTSAGAYRAALENLTEKGREAFPWEKIVFIGFNALTHIEIEILKILQDMGNMDRGKHPEDKLADFIWDATGPILHRLEEDSLRRNSAARFVVANRNRFPEPEWAKDIISRSDSKTLPPKIRAIASPSNVLQAKIAAEEVGKLADDKSGNKIKNARVAVVLPDESLLLPFMYGLPENVKDVNLTMGYPLKLTSVASFIGLLRNAVRNSRERSGTVVFYYQDIKLLMTHPYVKAIGGRKETEEFVNKADKFHQIFVSLSELNSKIPGLSEMFTLPSSKGDPIETLTYIEKLLCSVYEELEKNGEVGTSRADLDLKYIDDYRAGLRPLRSSIENYRVEMSRDTVFALAQKMTASLRVNFEGEPLKGLQVMGLLETRSLDFDIIILPSLNERILPMKSRSRTFIPNSIRAAYGLPPANYAENIFAYYFYRLISRAKEVILIYDARSGSGLRTGGESRYLHQLRHLFAPGHIQEEVRNFSISELTPVIDPIEKTPEVRKILDRYFVEDTSKGRDGRVLSASAVIDYCKCQKLFFFKHVSKIPERSENLLQVDPIKVGNIVHKTMEKLYSPQNGGTWPVRITADFIDMLLDVSNHQILSLINEVTIEELKLPRKIESALNSDYQLMRSTAETMVRSILKTDRRLARQSGGSFEVLGTETAGNETFEIGGGRKVKFRYSIDRTDMVGDRIRIVDYKTGKIHIKGEGFDEMFDGNSVRLTNFLQLMAYAGIARRIWPEETADGVEMVIYNVVNMMMDSTSDPVIVYPEFYYEDENKLKVTQTFESDSKIHIVRKSGRKIISDEMLSGSDIRKEFDDRLKAKIESIFDDPDFQPTPNSSNCDYCAYAGYCLR